MASLSEVLRAPAVVFKYPRARPRRKIRWLRPAVLALLVSFAAPELGALRVEEDRVGGWLLDRYNSVSQVVGTFSGVGQYTATGQSAGWDLPYACMQRCSVGDDSCYLGCLDAAWPGGVATMPEDARQIRQQVLERTQ